MSDSKDAHFDENDYEALLSKFKKQLDAGADPHIGEFLAKCRHRDQLSPLFVELLTLELELKKARGHLSEAVKRVCKQMYANHDREIDQVWLKLDQAKSSTARHASFIHNEGSGLPTIPGNPYKFGKLKK